MRNLAARNPGFVSFEKYSTVLSETIDELRDSLEKKILYAVRRVFDDYDMKPTCRLTNSILLQIAGNPISANLLNRVLKGSEKVSLRPHQLEILIWTLGNKAGWTRKTVLEKIERLLILGGQADLSAIARKKRMQRKGE